MRTGVAPRSAGPARPLLAATVVVLCARSSATFSARERPYRPAVAGRPALRGGLLSLIKSTQRRCGDKPQAGCLPDAEPMSDFGSRMGAAMLGQAASDAVIVTQRRLLAWGDTVAWPVWPVAHSFRIEVLIRSGLRGPPRAWPSRNAHSSSDGRRKRLPGISRPVGPAVGCSHRGSREHQRRGSSQDATLWRWPLRLAR